MKTWAQALVTVLALAVVSAGSAAAQTIVVGGKAFPAEALKAGDCTD